MGREQILRVHLQRRGLPLCDDVSVSALAALTTGFTGADLANLVNEVGAHTGGCRDVWKSGTGCTEDCGRRRRRGGGGGVQGWRAQKARGFWEQAKRGVCAEHKQLSQSSAVPHGQIGVPTKRTYLHPMLRSRAPRTATCLGGTHPHLQAALLGGRRGKVAVGREEFDAAVMRAIAGIEKKRSILQVGGRACGRWWEGGDRRGGLGGGGARAV